MTQATTLTQKDRGRVTDRLFWLLCITAGVVVLLVLGAILISTLREGWPALSKAGENGFFTSTVWDPNNVLFGTLAFVYGTIVVAIIALIFAVPISIGIALFVTELAGQRIKAVIVTVIDLLAAVPSVVFGLWGFITFAPAIVPVYQWLHNVLGPIPILGQLFAQPSHVSFMTAGIIVAVMIIPIITSITREVFDTVPPSDKHAAWALGATRWEMIKGAVFPHSFGGIVGGVILGLGRALGETVAVAMVIGSAAVITPNLFSPGYTIPSIILNQFNESAGIHTSALIAMGVVLFAVTVVINFLAEIIVRRAAVRMRGA